MSIEVIQSEKEEVPVRYEMDGEVIELDKVNRVARRLLVSQSNKLRKKFAHLKGKKDSEGRPATIVIRWEKAKPTALQAIVEFPEEMKDSIDGSDKAVRVA